jgi:hypothetical protein
MLPDIDLTSLVNPAALSQVPNLINVQDITIDEYGWESEQTPATIEIQPTPRAPELREQSPYRVPSPGGYEAPPIEGGEFFETPIIAPSPFAELERPLSPGGIEMPSTPVRITEEPHVPAPTPQAKKKTRAKRPRGLIVDDETEISGADFKKLLTNTGDIVRIRHRAPATREEFEAYQVEPYDPWTQPGLPLNTLAPELIQLYNEATSRYNARRDFTIPPVGVEPIEEARPELRTPGLSPIRAPTPGTGGIEVERPLSPGGFEEIGGYEMPPEYPEPSPGPVSKPRRSVVPLPLFDPDMQMVAQQNIEKRKSELFHEIVSEVDMREVRTRKEEQHEALKQKYAGKGITESTIQVIGVLQDHFAATKETHVILQDITRGMKRMAAARCFYETLVLKTRNLIDISQEEPFGEIEITNKMTA